jgi:hypothetical protein
LPSCVSACDGAVNFYVAPRRLPRIIECPNGSDNLRGTDEGVPTVGEKVIQSFKVKGTSGNVYLIERLDSTPLESNDRFDSGDTRRERTWMRRPQPIYRVASNHMVVDHNAADDTFRILGSGEVLRRI